MYKYKIVKNSIKEKDGGITLEFDLNNLNIKKSIIYIEKQNKKAIKKDCEIICNLLNYDESNEKHNEIFEIFDIAFINDKKAKYERIYDEVCEYLDKQFCNNLCEFKENRCGEKRNTNIEVGCCRHFKNKKIGIFGLNNKLITCEYLKDKHCSTKCISCKLFTCDFLNKKGIKFKIKDIPKLKLFFNPIQKIILKGSVFMPKEKIILKLLKFKLN